jgi:indole-3-glycerol phosphate synthase
MNNTLRELIKIDKEAGNTLLVNIHKERSLEKSICANCEKDVKEIDNEEYKISALCLICQEEFFKGSEDE